MPTPQEGDHGKPGSAAARIPDPARGDVRGRLRGGCPPGARHASPAAAGPGRHHADERRIGPGPAGAGRPGPVSAPARPADAVALPEAPGLLEFSVGGMTCSSCAARIERQLNRLDGVTATVSYATERAYVTSAGGRRAAELISVIETAGYTAELAGEAGGAAADGAARAAGARLAVCVPLAAATIVLAMVPAAQFRGWQWVSLLLAAPVATWGAWPLHRAAWSGLGHAAATMDTLVSAGVAASFG